jgi:hypothetical protein
MAVLLTAEAVAIALLAVLVAGVLRSHAEILRALRDAGIETGPAGAGAQSGLRTPPHRAAGATAHDVVGSTPDGEAVAIGIVGAPHDTVLAFLTTGCMTCAGFWQSFAEKGEHALTGARTVIVAHDVSDESESKVRQLAPRRVPVVMSSTAWLDYEVPGAPYFVHVDGASGRITGEGTASNWEQLVSLLDQAAADGRLGASHAPAGVERTGVERTDAAREARADRELLAAGYEPGDPRLHPEPGTPAGGSGS